ncbi:hypothetical protein EC919_104283 [Pseudomonas graminis]|nr:hypothetical protein EC919_104283 [Pseudomonas graminis]
MVGAGWFAGLNGRAISREWPSARNKKAPLHKVQRRSIKPFFYPNSQ